MVPKNTNILVILRTGTKNALVPVPVLKVQVPRNIFTPRWYYQSVLKNTYLVPIGNTNQSRLKMKDLYSELVLLTITKDVFLVPISNTYQG